MELVFATNNQHKLMEIQNLLNGHPMLLSLEDIGCREELPEDRETLEDNASQKAWYLYDKYGKSCFADDTGLEIDALNGEPGVYSARYAGPERSAESNMDKVLTNLNKINNRKARFRTVISLVLNGIETRFEGVVEGRILNERKGGSGFGYDPIFKPDESTLSFAEMSLSEKNKISHRARAFLKLVEFLNKQKQSD
jgi:XTP/dITP diphosphohydrolase